MVDKKAIGKKSRREGKAFEVAVRKDLISKGWTVCRFDNNVEVSYVSTDIKGIDAKIGKLVQSKGKFNPFTHSVMNMSSGFPDFICYKYSSDYKEGDIINFMNTNVVYSGKERIINYEVIGCESKMNGKLDKIEKEKCKWLLDNNIFSKILIASQDYPESNINLPVEQRKKKQINYEEFK